jgi:hypothetical protein
MRGFFAFWCAQKPVGAHRVRPNNPKIAPKTQKTGDKEKKREKIGNESKKGKKSTRVREFSSAVSRIVYMYYERQKNRQKREKEKRIKGNQVLGTRQTTRKPKKL